jgi:transposase InsO family protein
MVVVGRLIRYAHFCSLSHPFSPNTIVATFMDIVQKLHGNPKIIVSDRDPIFTRNFWIELFSCLGTQLVHGLSYHSQTNGKMKIVNKCLEGYFRFFASDKQTH